jgi:hypothetical protein
MYLFNKNIPDGPYGERASTALLVSVAILVTYFDIGVYEIDA